MKQLQEELTRRLDRLRDASARNSEAEVKETNKEVSEILQRMKDLSDQLEKEIPKKVLEMTTNEKQTVTLKKKKSKRSKKTTDQKDAKLVSRLSQESTSEEELVESTKPTFYPHSFTMRPSQFECEDFVGSDMMGKLQEERFRVIIHYSYQLQGLYNFSMIYLIATVTALCVYNLMQRGWLVHLSAVLCKRSIYGAILAVGLSVCIPSLYLFISHVYYGLWKLKELTHMSYPLYFTYYALWQCFYVMFNVYIIWNSIIPYNFIKMLIFSPLTSVLPLMLLVVFALKGHSFIFTNYGLEKQSTEHVPNSFGHFCYFMVCPTLLYELDYPRTTTIRLGYIVRTSMYMVAAFILMYVIMMQFVYPILSDTHTSMVFRILRCSLSALFIIWLLLFFSVFHCLLNILAEVTMFGDRLLYEDWWNATTILEFWKKWNGPIHYWCLRHVYVESQVYGKASKPFASFVTFLVSGIAHELVCSVAFRKPSLYFFMGMVVQVPLQVVSKYFENTRIGNIIVWVSLFLGQPLLELSYCQDWFVRYPSLFC
ncbi:diacylglycerol o-acyltransferase [Blastocystis sp. subtype 4]|uniref:diacylglycerol o-acyltransferase n=1 Tax=Blastocystis sp. subtype 4 TaxID=944170 RepID=UPI0007113366|nr:diacylglycerol o-acyltransferase [Blastocystis sp. subtype 4]KNB44047.1 diacylglycerol o-acyltransferase [Blastocystis sp. subtype 4]|eukprot:XP_014527490.1 diacylglycerol o-acyltransferase [Blastocystis sp. subtype 4]